MNLEEKLAYARRHLAGIARHDDAPETEVRAALEQLGAAVAEALDGLKFGRDERSERLKAWRAEKARRVATRIAERRQAGAKQAGAKPAAAERGGRA